MVKPPQIVVPQKITLDLVRAHYSCDKEYFKDCLMELVDFLNKENQTELAEYYLAQAKLIPTFDITD